MFADAYDAIEENLFYNVYFKTEELSDADTVVDLGAHVGAFTLYALLNCKYGSRIISIEPNPYAFKILINNAILFRRIRSDIELYPLNVAVWSSRSLVPLKLTSWSENVHVTRPSSEGKSAKKTIHVCALTMFDILKICKGKNVVLKIDIEGAEYEIFKNSTWLEDERISHIAVEIHGNIEPIVKVLKNSGFQVYERLIRYTSSAAKLWLIFRPLWYSIMMYFYRHMVANTIKEPQIRILYASRKA